MPVLEATPDETQIMRYKLVTATGTDATGTVVIPQITNINYTTQTLYYSPTSGQTQILDVEPKTTYTATSTSQEADAYTLILADSTLATVELLSPSSGIINPNNRGSIVAKGTVFRITALNKTGTTSVSIFGNNSGAVYNFSLSTVASA
jgi:hypothetical protein